MHRSPARHGHLLSQVPGQLEPTTHDGAPPTAQQVLALPVEVAHEVQGQLLHGVAGS